MNVNGTDIFAAVLDSKGCPTLKATIDTIVTQYLAFYTEKNTKKNKKSKKKISSPSCTLQTVCDWYNADEGEDEEVTLNAKDIGNPTSKTPFVIMLQDFEYFDPDLLRDLLTVLSHHRHNDGVPFVLLFALSTSADAVHRLLPQSVCSLLSTKTFQLQPSRQYLETIITEVVNNQ